MASPASGRLPRAVTFVGVPFAGLVLTLFFIFLGFPYDLLALRVSQLVEDSGQVTLHIGELSPHLGLAGPGFRATDVLAESRDGPSLPIDEAVVRPAWSLSWLGGTPALYLDLQSEMGNAEGVVTLGDSPGWQGELRGVELSELPRGQALMVVDLSGLLDADIDVHWTPEVEGRRELAGRLRLEAHDGSMSTDDMPFEIPYDLLQGEIALGGDHRARVEAFSIEGPVVSAEAQGTVGQAPELSQSPLDFEISYKVESPEIRSMLRGFGLRLAKSGEGTVKIGGTFAHPKTVLR
jgi:type II secretion system protein N